MRHNEDNLIEVESFIIEIGDTYHGGAWKVAYADFVTAMMAFFLLMWLLNVTTEEQKNAISNFFDPSHPKVSEATSGAGGVLGGLTMTPEGAMSSQTNPIIPVQVNKVRAHGDNNKSKITSVKKKAEEQRFQKAKEKLEKAIKNNKELAKLAKNLVIDMTPEGLRIQIVDQDGQPMFPSGSDKMYEKTANLLKEISGIILDMPNEISVRGHTDSARYGEGAKYTNWELSADRANASRRVLLESGIPADRLNNVMGKADTEHFIKDNPLDPQNRRISIILLKEELTDPDYEDDETAQDASSTEESGGNDNEKPLPMGDFQKTPGAVEFP